MCWISTRKDGKAIAKIAKKDIPIIKIGHRRFHLFVSAAYAYGYEMGKLQKPIKIEPRRRFYDTLYVDGIEEGYHFYKPRMIRIERVISRPLLRIWSVFGKIDFHHYTITDTLCIAKGYIPKGTVYYLNEDGEGVAEQLVITKMI